MRWDAIVFPVDASRKAVVDSTSAIPQRRDVSDAGRQASPSLGKETVAVTTVYIPLIISRNQVSTNPQHRATKEALNQPNRQAAQERKQDTLI